MKSVFIVFFRCDPVYVNLTPPRDIRVYDYDVRVRELSLLIRLQEHIFSIVFVLVQYVV